MTPVLNSHRVNGSCSEARVFADGVDSTLGFCDFWPIGEERYEVLIFKLRLLERMFRVPRIGNQKFCTGHVIRVWITIDESPKERSRLSEAGLVESLLGLLKERRVRFIDGFPVRYLSISEP